MVRPLPLRRPQSSDRGVAASLRSRGGWKGVSEGAGPPSGPELPEIPNLFSHFDASSLELSDNDLVEEWPDLSGNDLHVIQATESARPVYRENQINGFPALEFDGDRLLRIDWGSAIAQPFTVFGVVQIDSPTLFQTIFGRTEGSDNINLFQFQNQSNGEQWSAGADDTFQRSNSNSTDKWTSFSLVWQNNVDIYINGVFDDSGDIGTNGWHGITLGGGRASPSFEGRLAELIISRDLLGSEDLDEVHSYLYEKYGIE